MPPKLPDTIAACNLIKTERKAARNKQRRSYYKGITQRLSVNEGRHLSAFLKIVYDPKNDSVTVNQGLIYCLRAIFPGTNRKRTCTNEAALDALDGSRRRHRTKAGAQ